MIRSISISLALGVAVSPSIVGAQAESTPVEGENATAAGSRIGDIGLELVGGTLGLAGGTAVLGGLSYLVITSLGPTHDLGAAIGEVFLGLVVAVVGGGGGAGLGVALAGQLDSVHGTPWAAMAGAAVGLGIGTAVDVVLQVNEYNNHTGNANVPGIVINASLPVIFSVAAYELSARRAMRGKNQTAVSISPYVTSPTHGSGAVAGLLVTFP